MAYGNTSVSVVKSQEAIRRLVLSHGGTGVAFVSQPPAEGFHAQIALDGKTYTIRIVAQRKSLEEIRASKKRRISSKGLLKLADQEEKRIWRVLFYHMKGIFEAADTGVLEFRELILPYIVTKSGKTIAEHIIPGLESAIAGRPDRLLTAGKE